MSSRAKSTPPTGISKSDDHKQDGMLLDRHTFDLLVGLDLLPWCPRLGNNTIFAVPVVCYLRVSLESASFLSVFRSRRTMNLEGEFVRILDFAGILDIR